MSLATAYEGLSSDYGEVFQGAVKACPRDITLLVEEEEILVHKFVLAARSKYFNHFFSRKEDSQETAGQRGAASGTQDIVELSDVSHSNHQSLVEISDVTVQLSDNVIEIRNTKVEVMRAVLVFIYQGHYDLSEEVETQLLSLELAHQFRLRDLKKILINHLIESITVENFFDFYNMKMRYKNSHMEDSCATFLKENGEEIAKSDNFSKLTPESLLSLLDEESFAAAEIDIFRAAERWAGVNKPNKETVQDIVEKIRLATISQEDLFDVVKCSKELPSIDILEAIQSTVKKDAASTNFRQHYCMTVADLNVAQSSLGAEVLSGSVTGTDLISGSSGCTSHKVGGKPDCIAVKLDKTYWLNAVQLLLDSSEGRSYKYHVEVSVDEKEWLRVVDHSNYWCRSHQFLRFNPRAVKFIRMTGTDECLNIISFAALYSKEECSLVQGIQVASTNVVLESRGANVTGGYCGYSSWKPMYCIDGKNSFAAVLENFPLTIKLGQPHWLSSLRVRINALGNSYTIESSPDGESWQPVGGETKGEKKVIVWRTFEFSRRVVLHFRVTMKKIDPIWDYITLFHFESPASTTAVTN